MEQVYRGVVCKAEIIQGGKVLRTAQIYGRKLYNFTWHCAVGYNWKLRQTRWRNNVGVNGKREKWPGYIGIQKAMMDTEEYLMLSDRVAGYVLRGFDSSMRSWFSNLKSNPKARPPACESAWPIAGALPTDRETNPASRRATKFFRSGRPPTGCERPAFGGSPDAAGRDDGYGCCCACQPIRSGSRAGELDMPRF